MQTVGALTAIMDPMSYRRLPHRRQRQQHQQQTPQQCRQSDAVVAVDTIDHHAGAFLIQRRRQQRISSIVAAGSQPQQLRPRPRRQQYRHNGGGDVGIIVAAIVSIIICIAQNTVQASAVASAAAADSAGASDNEPTENPLSDGFSLFPSISSTVATSTTLDFSTTGSGDSGGPASSKSSSSSSNSVSSSVSSSITSSIGSGQLLIGSTKHFVPVTQAPSKTLHKRTGNPSGAAAAAAAASSGAHSKNNNKHKLITINDLRNHSREALSHEGSQRDSVVYLSDNSGYIPVTSLRSGGGRPGGGSGTSGSGGGGTIIGTGPAAVGVDLEAWRTDLWDRDYTTNRHRHNSTRVQHIEAECQDDYMKIRVGFNGSFSGLLYSAGYAYDPDCMYINGSGRDYYEFYIQLNRCGTLGKNAIHDKTRENPTNFMWNTITVQYNPLIEEEFDEHFKVTCEYGYDFWKTVTFPFLDVEVATGNPVVFTLSPPECYMEIRNGYGVAGNRVTGPVRVGDPLTLIIYMRSKYDGFDIVVNDCYAHNGATKRIQLIDEYGCPVDEKLISRFRGTWSESGVYETQVYAYMKTFRFTGSPALYIECDVRMCHGRCPSQPCHWRNLKSISKRDVSNQTIELTDEQQQLHQPLSSQQPTTAAPQSDNVSLFQSLRVLQEGEEEATAQDAAEIRKIREPNETCMKTSVLSTISAGGSMLLCVLLVSLMLTCSKLRNRKRDASIYDAYVNHKGQID